MVLASSLPAPYLLMLGVLLRRATGIPQAWAIALSAVFCLLYIGARGFRSVVQTKGLQFALMYGGFLLLLPIAIFRLGGVGTLRTSVPAESFSVLGGQTAGYVVAWYFIALQTLVEPTFFQRCFAAESPAVAKRGLFVSIAFFAVFDGLTTFTGLYARALLPDLSSGVEAFPALGEMLLPAGLLGVFYAGMLATVMSTVDSYLFNAGISLSRDLAGRLGRRAATTIFGERVGLVLATVIAVLFALSSSSVVNLWYGFGSVATAVLLAPILGVFFPALRPRASFVAPGMVVSGAVALSWVLSGLRPDGPWLGIEPVYPGLMTAAAVASAGIAARAPDARPAP
jgi:SSS family solute:Na+ symporter